MTSPALTPLAEPARAFLSRLAAALGPLPEPVSTDITREIASHLAERQARGDLDAAIAALGDPHDFARTFVEDYDLTNALNRASPVPLLINILGRSARSTLAFVTGFLAIILYAFAAAFTAVAILKPITPRNVGFWRTGSGIDFGAIYGTTHSQPELIGYWIIPIGVLGAMIAYLVATLLLKAAGKLFLRTSLASGLSAAVSV
jgi:hypothetical protein